MRGHPKYERTLTSNENENAYISRSIKVAVKKRRKGTIRSISVFFTFLFTSFRGTFCRRDLRRDPKPLNHLGKPRRLPLDARNSRGWKTIYANSCKSDELPPTDGALIATASAHLLVAQVLEWLNRKRRAMQCGNEEPMRLGCRP